MPDDLQTCNPIVCSPRRLAKKIESCILRNALEEEQRAQKALYLLQARDRRIALLEKRVAELEDAAANLHEITLRNSSASSILERKDRIVPDFSRGEKSFKMDNRDGKSDTTVNSEMSIPCLELSKSSVSDSERDIFSTAIDFVLENRKCFTSNTSFSNEEVTSEKVTGREKFPDENLDRKSMAEVRAKYSEKKKMDRKEIVTLKEVMRGKENTKGHGLTLMGKSEEKFRDVLSDKKQELNCPRISSSVPWIPTKNSFRKKLRGFEVRNGKKMELVLLPGDGDSTFATFRYLSYLYKLKPRITYLLAEPTSPRDEDEPNLKMSKSSYLSYKLNPRITYLLAEPTSPRDEDEPNLNLTLNLTLTLTLL
ncbi:PREDICTED: uncharacterized protein LOC108550797 [Eufriesea mexicana]|uniref:uncharacterized protein LOC108550797 n=1 Tax=Eufriesea mexicana TaxID=516756 RepID=UPI00083BED5C|nr:PREDICTED: uncharacterized protein LOC108550797 [Eufriesea mexicana]